MKKLLYLLLLPLSLSAGERVVSLSPAVTELVIYAGGGRYLCGKSSACRMAGVRHLPIVGDLGKPYVEKVLKCRATLLLSDVRHPHANWQLLRRCRVKTEILPTEKLSDLPGNLQKIGKLLDLPEAKVKADNLSKKIAILRENRPARSHKAAIIFGVSPLISCGKNSFISEALSFAGAENIAADAGRGYFIISPEYLCASEAETIYVIGVPERIVRQYFSRPVFRMIPAVKNSRIIFLDEEKWSKLTPATIDAAEKLQRGK